MSKYPAKLRNSRHLCVIATDFIINNYAILGFIIVFLQQVRIKGDFNPFII